MKYEYLSYCLKLKEMDDEEAEESEASQGVDDLNAVVGGRHGCRLDDVSIDTAEGRRTFPPVLHCMMEVG